MKQFLQLQSQARSDLLILEFGSLAVFAEVSLLFIPHIRPQNDLRRAADLGDFLASAFLTGGLRFIPCALAAARPLALRPPLGFLPSALLATLDISVNCKAFNCVSIGALIIAWSACISAVVTFGSGSIWLYKSITMEIYNRLISAPSLGNYFNTNIRNKHEAEVIAKVGKSSVIVYSKGEEIGEEKQKEQEA